MTWTLISELAGIVVDEIAIPLLMVYTSRAEWRQFSRHSLGNNSRLMNVAVANSVMPIACVFFSSFNISRMCDTFRSVAAIVSHVGAVFSYG